MLTKCIGILKKLLEKGEFTEEGDIRAKQLEYERLSSPLTQFISTFCEIHQDFFEATYRLFDGYKAFCAEHGFRLPATKNEFNNMLRCNYEVEKQNKKDYKTNEFQTWVWVYGLRLKDLSNLSDYTNSISNTYLEHQSEKVDKLDKLDKKESGGSKKNLSNLVPIIDTKIDKTISKYLEIKFLKDYKEYMDDGNLFHGTAGDKKLILREIAEKLIQDNIAAEV